MALQSSGQISISDIKTELGTSSSSNLNLKGLETGTFGTINTGSASYPNGSAPYAMSEWYSYDHSASSWSNSYALDYDGVNDYVRGSLSSHPSQEFSISMWVRNDETSKRNMFLYSTVHTENNSNNGRFAFSIMQV